MRKPIFWIAQLVRFLTSFYYKKRGVQIGKNTMISFGAKIDTHRGRIVIGNDCLITHGVKILSHDGATPLTDPSDDGDGEVVIGDKVFIGVNSVILRNVKVGNNVVIGAGSVVTLDIPDNSLVAGNPGRVVRTLQPTDITLNKIKSLRK